MERLRKFLEFEIDRYAEAVQANEEEKEKMMNFLLSMETSFSLLSEKEEKQLATDTFAYVFQLPELEWKALIPRIISFVLVTKEKNSSLTSDVIGALGAHTNKRQKENGFSESVSLLGQLSELLNSSDAVELIAKSKELKRKRREELGLPPKD